MNQVAPIGRMPLQHLSLDKLIQFGDHFLVDHPVIDAQHKAIFELGVRIHEDWLSAPGDALVRFILGMTVGHVAASDMRYCRALTPSSTPLIHS